MTSLISVYETPVRMDIIFEQYKEGDVKVDKMELIDRMPEPELSKDEWYKKYGNREMLWRVKIVHGDNISLGGYRPYFSWEGVERAIKYPKKKKTFNDKVDVLSAQLDTQAVGKEKNVKDKIDG